jgi:glycosyltransferase involved in cell wall biosynthesis
MKVLFIARRYPPSVGGMERYAYDLHNAISDQAQTYLIKWGGKSKLTLIFILPYFFIRAIYALLTKNIDIIHIQDGLQAPMGLVLKLIFRKPLVIVIHGLDVTYSNWLYQKIIPACLNRADHIFCISNAAKHEVLIRGVNEKKVTFVPLGITDDIFKNNKKIFKQKALEILNIKDPQTKIILSVGRLVRRKGISWFIENVFGKVVEGSINKITLVIAGEGEEAHRIRETVKMSKFGKNIHLLGRVNEDKIKTLYNGSDIFIMPNIKVEGDMEGFGRVLLEASLCEIPVVASGIEGINDAIENNMNGFLIHEKDEKYFANTIINLLSDEKAAIKFAKKSRKYSLKNYSWDKVSSEFIKVYKKIII